MDLPRMKRCKVDAKGRHELNVVIPDEYDRDMTLFCANCGALRRVPVSGQLLASRLDDLTAAEILLATAKTRGPSHTPPA